MCGRQGEGGTLGQSAAELVDDKDEVGVAAAAHGAAHPLAVRVGGLVVDVHPVEPKVIHQIRDRPRVQRAPITATPAHAHAHTDRTRFSFFALVWLWALGAVRVGGAADGEHDLGGGVALVECDDGLLERGSVVGKAQARPGQVQVAPVLREVKGVRLLRWCGGVVVRWCSGVRCSWAGRTRPGRRLRRPATGPVRCWHRWRPAAKK